MVTILLHLPLSNYKTTVKCVNIKFSINKYFIQEVVSGLEFCYIKQMRIYTNHKRKALLQHATESVFAFDGQCPPSLLNKTQPTLTLNKPKDNDKNY